MVDCKVHLYRSCELDLVKVTIEAYISGDGPKMFQAEPWRWIETSIFHQVELYLLCDPGYSISGCWQ